MDIKVISFSSIDVNTMSLTVDFVMDLTWFDGRLSFYNLKESRALNSLSLEEMKALWIPTTVFVNSPGNTFSLVDDSTESYVLRNGTPSLNTREENKETRVYQGDENPLVSKRKYTITFTCNFNLKDYPFDIQRCFMYFKLKEPTKDQAMILMRNVFYTGDKELLEYRVQNTSFENNIDEEDSYSVARIEIVLKRRVGNQLLSTYLPTASLLLIIYLSHYFKIDHYDTRIMVGLTG